ncbi:hypothetical protein QEH59_00155 [Coraliomargarita sp. SDUM461004]|uniref:DUF3108 domain-containing protein n=1 Tax=Thalassobacterium sedimentorum TaxID=3041258 RepID=A0ABU1AEA7_9BACT|nr:hypothetical protein [Coraliomargarita sp. SDUM461004]MDQ8192814.1 hypothetical protein [Coraliomargarita sp. SDUM461004]
MHKLKTFLFIFGVIVISNRVLAEGTVVSADFSSIYWMESERGSGAAQLEAPDLYFQEGQTYRLLEPYLSQLGPAMNYHGPSQMILYRRQLDDEGLWQYLPALTVQLPSTNRFLLFLAESKNQPSSVTAAAIDISANSIPAGQIGLLNLTRESLAADLRGDRQTLSPLKLEVFTPKEHDDVNSLPLRIAVFKEEWKPVYATVTRINPDRPYLMVFYLAGSREGAYRMRIFRNIEQVRTVPPTLEED